MIRFNRVLTYGLLALAMNAIGTAYGQYQVTGTTAGGGNVVTADGNALGSIVSGDGTLTVGGFDNVTFNVGSVAIGSGVSTVQFLTQGNTVTVNGTINSDLGYSSLAYDINTAHETITIGAGGVVESGSGTPDTGSGGGAASAAIYISTSGSVLDFHIGNAGTIVGGQGGASAGNNHLAGDGGHAVSANSQFGIDGFTFGNSGFVHGSAGGDAPFNNVSGGSGGTALFLTSLGPIQNIAITNSGTMSGGDAGSFGKNADGNNGGAAISIGAIAIGDVTGVSIISTGTSFNSLIQGGNGGSAAIATANNGGSGGVGIFIGSGSGAVSNITIANTQTGISGGSGGAGGNNHTSGDGGSGIFITGDTGISGVSITNTEANIGGGSGANGGNTKTAGGDGGFGILLETKGSIQGVFINNYLDAAIFGGSGGAGATNADGGSGGAAISVLASGDIGNLTIRSNFLLGGGGGGGSGNDKSYGGQGGEGVIVRSGTGNITNFHFYNGGDFNGGYGGLAGKNAEAGNGGVGLFVVTSGSIAGTQIQNVGQITGGGGGGGTADKVDAGRGGNAIQLSSDLSITNTFITNSYVIQAGEGGSAAFNGNANFGGDGIYLGANTFISGLTVQNSNFITGGKGGSATGDQTGGEDGGAGIVLSSPSISGILVTNFFSGVLEGGDGGTGSKNNDSGDGSAAIAISSIMIDGITIQNAGRMRGGAGGISTEKNSVGGQGGSAITISSGGSVAKVSILNVAGGSVRGGNAGGSGNNAIGNEGGDAISLVAGTSLDGITIQNAGRMRGGRGRNGDDADNLAGGAGGSGIKLVAGESITGLGIGNSGTIRGGSSGNKTDGNHAISLIAGISIDGADFLNSGLIRGGDAGFSNNFVGALGATGGLAVNMVAGDSVIDFSLVNSGTMLGGNGGDTTAASHYPGSGGAVFKLDAFHEINGMQLINTGVLKGGTGGNSVSFGYGGYGGDAVNMHANDSLKNILILNTGTIEGGNSNGLPYTGGVGIYLASGTGYGDPGIGNMNIHVVNFGTVKGGSGLDDGFSGYAVQFRTEHTVFDNWGTVSAGEGYYNGSPFVAMLFQGNYHTVNLLGHSITNGVMVGNASVADSNHLNLKLSGISPGQAVVIAAQLQAQGALTGHESTGTVVIHGLLIQWEAMVVGFQPVSYQLQGLTPNEQALGASLDSLLVNPTGELLDLYNAIDHSGNVPAALDQLSPQRYQIYGDIALQNANFNSLQIDQRLNNLSDGSESVDTTGMGGASDATVLGFSKDDKGKDVVDPVAPMDRRWGFFGSGNLGVVNIEGRAQDVTTSSRFTSAGMVMGLDGKINDKWVVGTMFHFVNTSARLDAFGGTADIDSIGGGLYTGYHDGPVYANGLLTYTHNDYDAQRAIAIPGFSRFAASNTDGDQFSGNIDGGYDFKLSDCVTVGPIAGLQYVHLGVNGFSETGAGAANLTVGDHDVDSLRSKLGIRIDFHKRINSEFTLAVEGRAQWQHEFLDDSEGITSSFTGAGLNPFTVQTSAPERDAALVGIGANVTIRNRLTIFVDYDAQIGQASYLEQSVRAGLKLSW